MSEYLDETKALRDKAWADVTATHQYKVYAALKLAAEAMAAVDLGEHLKSKPRGIGTAVIAELTRQAVARVSHASAAESALRKAGEPLPVGRLLEAALVEGANVGGNDPLANFRSSLSKDNRFESIMRGGMYFWWFKGERPPTGWNDAGAGDFEGLLTPASSVSSNQETANCG